MYVAGLACWYCSVAAVTLWPDHLAGVLEVRSVVVQGEAHVALGTCGFLSGSVRMQS